MSQSTPTSDTLDIKGQTILVVDDNPTNLGVITNFLETHGFMVYVARDGKSAIETAEYAPPHLILLDVMMPGIDGFETCRQLKTNRQLENIPVIFMTALSSAEDKVKGFEVGAVDYVTKPIQQGEVLARVSTHLRIQALTKQLQQANTQLEEQNKELAELNASKDKFFSIISHDLRTPFSSLMGNSQMMLFLEDITMDEVQVLAGRMFNSAKATLNLLDNLLMWSRMQQGYMEYQPSQIHLHTLTQITINLLTELAHKKNIQLVNDVNKDIFIYGDENMIDMVIRNLTSNALKFTPAGGNVTLQTFPREDNRVEIVVKDTGVGISKEQLPKLFRTDEHITTLGTAKETGTGLGLILCQEMIEKNRGEIWVESQSNQGTSVHFTLPASKLEKISETA